MTTEEDKAHHRKNEALAHSLDDAEVLVAYVIRNNIQGVQDAVEGMAEARECYGRGEFSADAQKKFYADFSKLAAKVAPVTVSTLKASLEDYGPGRTTWFGLGERVPCSHAQRAGIFHRRWGMVALITLLVIQSYWLVGSNLLNAIPKFSDTQQTALLAVEAKKRLRATVNPTQQLQPSPAPQPAVTEKDVTSEAALLAAEHLVDERTRIADMLATWCKVLLPDSWVPRRAKAEGIHSEEFEQLDSDRVIALASRVLEVLQQYVLPLLYGWLGAMAYVLRTLGQQSRARLFSTENQTDFNLRVWLGVVAGLAIGWFFRSDKGAGPAVGSLSALALAFVAGYSVDLLFTAMDRIVAAFSTSSEKPPAKEEARSNPQPAVKPPAAG
jgi:hypothetical protein